VALADVPVLITGESGTGKELVAHAIHDHSRRADKPFVTVDCGVLSPTLIASELFGHERGSFTGADRQRIGAFERANGGTIFLDEVGELPAELQPQLLGALERRRFCRVGGQHEIDVDVRVVTATNRELRSEVNTSAFRLDLYYRIAVVTLQMPALRQRTDDIPLLVDHFLKAAGHEGSMSTIVSSDTLAELARYRWPGNVRELRNWVEAMLAIGEAPELSSQPGDTVEAPNLIGMSYKDARARVLADFEQRYFRELLDDCSGNVSKAARHARMDRSYLIKILQRHGLK
jgi:DNA-binding NtrC family response regulator